MKFYFPNILHEGNTDSAKDLCNQPSISKRIMMSLNVYSKSE